MKNSKYKLLLNYINNNDIIKPFEVRKYLNLGVIDNSISSYINILHNAYYLKRIDIGIYVKNINNIDIKLNELMKIYKKMRNDNFRIKYFRKLKLNRIIN
jgi:hypothetical protein